MQRPDEGSTETALGEGPFRGRDTGGDITACTEPYNL